MHWDDVSYGRPATVWQGSTETNRHTCMNSRTANCNHIKALGLVHSHHKIKNRLHQHFCMLVDAAQLLIVFQWT